MLDNQAHRFNLPDDIVYLNTAFMGPQLDTVEHAALNAIEERNHPYRIVPDDLFAPVRRLRERFAALVEAPSADQIAVIPSVSYGMASVARNVPLGQDDEIVLIAEQFPSNVYGWQALAEERGGRVVTVAAPASASRGAAWNEALLAAITERTRVVAMPQVHWADGTWYDLRAVRARTREVGAWLVIDGTQSVGALPFSVAEIEPDALVCAGYKWLLGPYGLGLAYYGPALDGGTPIEHNWINRRDSHEFAKLVNYQPAFGPGAARYSMGEQSNFLLVPMLTAALEQVHAWTVPAIQDYARRISLETIPALRELGCTVEDGAWRGHHLFGIGLPPDLPADRLKAELQRRQVHVSYRGAAVRVAVHVYNRREDLATLVDGVRVARAAVA